MIRHLLCRLCGDRRGALVAEFAATMPVLGLLLLAGVEVGRLALVNQKLDRVATSMADLVAQAETLTGTELNSLFASTGHVAWPFDLANEGIVIVSSVSDNSGTPRINWQRTGGGGLPAGSAIGVEGGVATLPDGMVVRANETIIVAEVYFDFEPVFVGAIAPAQRLYHRAFFRPRLGTLTTLG